MITTAQVPGVVSAQGLDVSNYQGRYDWAGAVRQIPALAFGIHRLTQGLGGAGTSSPDPDAAWNHGQISSYNLIRGAYHFLSSQLGGLAQARYFAAQIRGLGPVKATDMFWCDNEDSRGSPAHIASVAADFMNQLHTEFPHNLIGVYSNMSFAQGGYCAGLGHWPWWAAHPGSAPAGPPVWAKWVFWQWGQRNGTDADAFNGTVAELHQLIGGFAPASGPYRHITEGTESAAQIAARRNLPLDRFLGHQAEHYSAADWKTLGDVKIPRGTPYYTEQP